MRQKILAAVCAGALLSGQPWAFAQERIYRCGNEYTNNQALAKQRNCQVIEGGHVTVIHNQSPGLTGGNTASASKSAQSPSPNRAVKVEAGQQKARDSDARSILQAELTKAQERLGALRLEFNEGNPTKTALELRNPQVFNERLEQLKASITRQESDVTGIQRELERHPGG